jgi:hypothetical protein
MCHGKILLTIQPFPAPQISRRVILSESERRRSEDESKNPEKACSVNAALRRSHETAGRELLAAACSLILALLGPSAHR